MHAIMNSLSNSKSYVDKLDKISFLHLVELV